MIGYSRRSLMLSALTTTAFLASSVLSQSADSCNASQYFDQDSGECVDFASPEDKAYNDLSTPLDTGNTAWMLAASALVMIMTPGVAFFYAGLAGENMASNTMMMSFASVAVVTIQWWVFGYSVCFSAEGLFDWAGYNRVDQNISGVYGSGIPGILFALFQNQFAAISPALLSGGIVGRMKFGSYLLFILLWTSIVYDPLARWMWGLRLNSDYEVEAIGWEGKMGTLDFAGGTVIHISSGFGAMVAAIVVGKRHNHGEPVKPHNVPLVMIGCTLLWFGWFGFNAGSAGAANGVAATAAMNTHVAASAGLLSWIGIEYAHKKTFDPCGAASGAISGLVCITPACGFVLPWHSVIFGLLGALTGYIFIEVKNKLRFDDTLDSFAIHGCAGFMGGLLTGLFAVASVGGTDGAFYGHGMQFVHQLASQCFAAAYSTACTFVILMLLKYTVGLRVDEDKERGGMDISYHGGGAYEYNTNTFQSANPPAGSFQEMMTPATTTESGKEAKEPVSSA